MTIVLRGEKGSALTHDELDGNFEDLEGQVAEKLTAAELPSTTANYRGQGDETLTAAFAAVEGAGSLPVEDTTTLVRDPGDPTKLVRIDAGAIATETTRVIFMGDRDVDLAVGGTFVEQTDFSSRIGFSAPTTKTIASGSITPDAGITLVDTEGSASEDTLDTIVKTNFPEGSLLLLQSVHADRNVVVTNAAGGSEQVLLADGANLTLDDPSQQLLLRSAGDDGWIEIGRFWGSEVAAFRTWLELGALALADTVGSSEITNGAVTGEKMAATAVTPGEYSNATFTVDQQGRLTAAASGSAPEGGLSTVLDDGTTITVGDAITGTHRVLTAGTSITLTLDAQATVGTKAAFTPGGAGAVGVEVESGAGYRVPGDDYEESARTDSFDLLGYGYFECTRNTDDDSAEWGFVGDSNLPSTVGSDLAFGGNQITESVQPLADDEETASFTFALAHGHQKMVRCNHASTPITATVPPNGTIAFPIGSVLNVVQWGDAAVTIAAGDGVTINQPASKTLVLAEKYAVASLWKQATNTWALFGHLTDA